MSEQFDPRKFARAMVGTGLASHIGDSTSIKGVVTSIVVLALQDVMSEYMTKLVKFLVNFPRKTLSTLIRLLVLAYKQLREKFATRVEEPVVKEVIVPWIAESSEINDIFDAVLWFVTQNTVLDEKQTTHLAATKTSPQTSLSVPNDGEGKFFFEGVEVKYSITTKEIEIHAERSYKRMNRFVNLKAEMLHSRSAAFFERLAAKAKTLYAEVIAQEKFKQKIYRTTAKGWEGEEIVGGIKRRLDTIITRNGQTESLVKAITEFKDLEEYYTSRGVPHVLTVYAYGPPGTGKSSLALGIANLTGRNVFYFDLKAYDSDEAFFKAVSQIKASGGLEHAVLVFEEIDTYAAACKTPPSEAGDVSGKTAAAAAEEILAAVSSSSKNASKKEGVTRAGLLKFLDGNVLNIEHTIILMTTNFPEKIDEALTRAGRTHKTVEMQLCDAEQIRGIFQKMCLADPPFSYDFKPDVISPADVSTTCIATRGLSINEAWSAVIRQYEKCCVGDRTR